MTTWGPRGTLAAVGVAAVIAGLGGAGIYSATGATSHEMGGHGGFGEMRPAPFGGPHGRDGGPPAAGPLEPVHSESVIDVGAGHYRTDLVQTGTVTAVSATSVTARSTDGFVQTYVVPASVPTTRFVPGDEVVIHATRTAGAATITDIAAARH